jgi:hypothetical protein
MVKGRPLLMPDGCRKCLDAAAQALGQICDLKTRLLEQWQQRAGVDRVRIGVGGRKRQASMMKMET